MYQVHADIFRKIGLYVTIARGFKSDIHEVTVSNEIEEHFGRKYCRVYVNIELKDGSLNHKLHETLWNEFSRYGEKDYFSFYLTADRRDNEDLLRNIEELTHYDYIWNLLEWYLQKDGIKVNAARFKSQLDLKYEQDLRNRKYEQERKLIADAVSNLTPELGQFIAIKQWSNSLRIGKVQKVILSNKRQSFSMELSELRKDLTPGKVNINLRSKTEIYAIVQPEKLNGVLTKADLISYIEQNRNFDGLLWRMPQGNILEPIRTH
ncbi:hypothetical protein [Flavisolibacter ginsenosidimutans]|uniref:Uncharacterized protein n=1 Tax=Flavisolibacter ginsenosidimutans TaxID=661481 RepID=A0A5B8UJS5_9BACT|nr:hypothetical protein [Flavisolibacter ginsenosidimutans]QEC56828.1 hypothetical protein FSB75_13275 [Flavisolibacter ginsenosidimutans]